MSAKYFALLTNIGAARLANATALGSRLNITRMAVGDGGGVLPTPNPAQTKLINEKRRAALNTLSVDPKNPSQIIAEQVIPENEGGWWIREIGLFDDDGNLIAVANCPETYKPQLQEGSGRIQTVRMILIVSSTDAVTLKIDPAVVLATRGYVDNAVIEVKAYADNLMRLHLAAADPHPQYASKVSPALTGKPTAPTAAQTANDTQLATTAFVKAAVSALVNGSPGALDTLQELAKALGNDPNFSTTMLTELGKKLPLAGGTMTGTLVSSVADAVRMVNGGYGVTLRNDGGDFYLLLTDKEDPYGKWNSLRPFRINLATGDVALGHRVDADTLLEKSQRVYSPNNKPSAADVGALTDAQAAQKYARLESPALIGKPTAPTAVQASNDTQIATTAFVKAAISALINGSPGALDTLQELAQALGNDPNFSTTILNALAGKLSLTGGKMSGRLETNDIVKVTGAGSALPDSQGAFLCWNRVNGEGRTDFVNHRGSGRGGFSFWNGNHEALSELLSLTSNGSLYVSGMLYEVGKRVYSPNNKPTPEDIGTYSKDEGDARYLRKSGGTLSGEIISTAGNALRLTTGDYAVMLRNDGGSFYLLLTNKGDINGNWNALRPFRIDISNGNVELAHNVSVGGNLTEKGQRVYSPSNKPTAADVGALTDAQAAQKYAMRSIRVNGKPLSADVNLLAGDINAWNKTEADARYLMKGLTVPGTITATGSGEGYYWRKYADGIIELFGTFETVINASRDVAFPVKLGEVLNITWNEVGGYSGANAFVGRVSGVSGTGFTHHWDVWDSNRYGSGNSQTIHYHVLAKAA